MMGRLHEAECQQCTIAPGMPSEPFSFVMGTIKPADISDRSFRGDIAALTIALDQGQDIWAKDRSGTTIMHKAAANGHLQCLQLLVEKGGNLNTQDITGCIPLHSAARNGHLKTVKWLVDQGCDVNTKSNKGSTPLDMAKRQSHSAVSKYLKDCGREKFDWELAMEESAKKGML